MPTPDIEVPNLMKRLISEKVFVSLVLVILSALMTITASPLNAEETKQWQVGGRLGFDDGRNDEDFNQAEVFFVHLWPLALGEGTPVSVSISMEGSAGVISGGSTEGFVGALGPGLALALWDDRVLLKAGVSPTIISQDNYGDEDLGGPVQFTSHIGLAARVYAGLSVGYRLQHMSNAGLYDKNPGVNLHMIELSWRF